ncbi:hypothetical protein BDW75DRAFT_196167 [Aspergillus navahoensis]
MPSLKSAVALSLLPELLAARSIPLAKRGVDCSFSIAASSGDSCESFAASWGVSVDDLKSLNPGLDCTNFDDFADYCVMGDVTADEPSSSSTTTATKEATTTTTDTTTIAVTTTIEKPTTTTTSTTSTATGNAPSPTQPGLASDCDEFHKVASGDQCDTIEANYGIINAQFSSWNPYIDDHCSNLWLDYYVCVHVSGASTTTSEPAPAQTSTAPSTGSDTNTNAPSPTQAGIDANCDKYHKVVSGDQCDTIESQYGITHADFSAWNPSIDDRCSNLWLDYYVCVHVAPKPQMPDITSDCKSYHKVQSGEGCWAIDSAYGITLDQFRKWNPTIDASCSNLWVDYYVCVGV